MNRKTPKNTFFSQQEGAKILKGRKLSRTEFERPTENAQEGNAPSKEARNASKKADLSIDDISKKNYSRTPGKNNNDGHFEEVQNIEIQLRGETITNFQEQEKQMMQKMNQNNNVQIKVNSSNKIKKSFSVEGYKPYKYENQYNEVKLVNWIQNGYLKNYGNISEGENVKTSLDLKNVNTANEKSNAVWGNDLEGPVENLTMDVMVETIGNFPKRSFTPTENLKEESRGLDEYKMANRIPDIQNAETLKIKQLKNIERFIVNRKPQNKSVTQSHDKLVYNSKQSSSTKIISNFQILNKFMKNNESRRKNYKDRQRTDLPQISEYQNDKQLLKKSISEPLFNEEEQDQSINFRNFRVKNNVNINQSYKIEKDLRNHPIPERSFRNDPRFTFSSNKINLTKLKQRYEQKRLPRNYSENFNHFNESNSIPKSSVIQKPYNNNYVRARPISTNHNPEMNKFNDWSNNKNTRPRYRNEGRVQVASHFRPGSRKEIQTRE